VKYTSDGVVVGAVATTNVTVFVLVAVVAVVGRVVAVDVVVRAVDVAAVMWTNKFQHSLPPLLLSFFIDAGKWSCSRAGAFARN